MRGLAQQICNQKVTRRLPSILHSNSCRLGVSHPDLSHMSQSLSHFSATVQLLQQKTSFGQPQSIAMPLKICLCSVASSRCRYKCLERVWFLRPECVHLQVSCTFDPARKSTDRPAAESILSRALIGSPMRVRSFCTCGNSFRPMTAA